MSALPEARPLSLVTRDKLRRIREVLDQAGYIERGVLAVLDTAEWPPSIRRRRARHLFLHRTRGGTPLETLVRLFLLEEPVALETARRALQPLCPEDWVEVGLLRVAGAAVRGTVQVWAYRDLLAAADWPGRPAGPRPLRGPGRARGTGTRPPDPCTAAGGAPVGGTRLPVARGGRVSGAA
jgi:hypothetical protein